ncbi:MAG: DHHA1 domain-containing protein [archaeon]|nr:DHHA1 domain-containing protein [archaeon]
MANKSEVIKFIRNIKLEDRVDLIFHNDLDGFASGILFYDMLTERGCKNIGIFPFEITNNHSKETKEINGEKVIILDLALNIISPVISKLKDKKILYIDHHKTDKPIENPNVLEYRNKEGEYTPCSRMVFELIGGREWLSVAGTVSDIGYNYPENKKFIDDFLKGNNLKFQEFFDNTVNPLSYLLIFLEKNPQMAFEIIKDTTNYKQVENLRKYTRPAEEEVNKFIEDFRKNNERLGKVNFYFFKPKLNIRPYVITSISLANPKEIYVFACPENGKVSLSARNNSKEEDVLELLGKATQNLENSSFGGHVAAAGGYIQKQDLEKFKENLRKIKL